MTKCREMQEFRDLWQRAFGDSEQYIDYYFSTKVPRSRKMENRQGEKLCAMAFFTPYEAVLYGKVISLSYLVGVATEEAFRHQGRMTRILEEGLSWEKEQGNPLVFLSPADCAIYQPLGFQSVYWRKTLRLTGSGEKWCEILSWQQLSGCQKNKVSDLVEDILKKEKFDLRLVHSVPYYEEVQKELQVLGGGLLTFWRDEKPLAVANWICEKGEHEVTEWIGLPEEREHVLQTLQWYIKDEVSIEDTYFLQNLQLVDIQWRQQKQPYLMVRMLDASVDVPKRCYINDIT